MKRAMIEINLEVLGDLLQLPFGARISASWNDFEKNNLCLIVEGIGREHEPGQLMARLAGIITTKESLTVEWELEDEA